MRHGNTRNLGWQGVVLVAVTYVYFLIFAQFAFVHRLASLGLADTYLKAIMAAMAAGGILLSLLAPRLRVCPSPRLRLRAGLLVCGAAALLTLPTLGPSSSMAVSFSIGAGLGFLAVTLATDLRQWTGTRSPLFKVGLGTGIGYLISNFPPLFTASPQAQAETAAILCLAGICATLRPPALLHPQRKLDDENADPSFLRVLAGFTALVWLDSAAFFIIQSTAALKSGTWEGSIHLWTNGLLHLAAALASAWFLRLRGLWFVLSAAFLALGLACLLLLDPNRLALASVFYPIGVSFYSVALVAYPSLIAPANSIEQRGRLAGWIYAIAGWGGSAMGIGMGQNLGHVPPVFVLAAGCVVLLPWLLKLFMQRKREVAATSVVLLAAFCIERIVQAGDTSPQLTHVQRGRQVYISEGCIDCHSQYVRPNSPDVLIWGPVESLQELRSQRPTLIGNRRQGPDLAEVGGRRSPLWLKAHFYNPAAVSDASIMPSYGFLFRDERGGDLLSYLESLKGAGSADHLAAEKAWHLSPSALQNVNSRDGELLFQRHCATCHNADGRTRRTWQTSFKRLPTDFAAGPLLDLPGSDSSEQRIDRIAQMSKFGIPGTDMPGHEYLSDQEIASISVWLSQSIAPPVQNR
jgi:cbb3-type cytochrome oxidase cytochrome c subunit